MKIKQSIKTEMIAFLLILIAVSIGITAYIGTVSITNTGYEARQITSSVLSSQSENFLLQLTQQAADKNDMVFDNIWKDASSVAAYAKNVFDNPDAFAIENYWKFDEHVFVGEHGQHLNGMNETSSLFIPNHIDITDDLKKGAELSAYLDNVFPMSLQNEPNAVAIWIVGIVNKSEYYARYYPNIGLGNIAPPDEKFIEEVFVAIANPENNPNKTVVWTPVYDDPAGQGLMITTSAPIYTKKGFYGVLGIDVTLKAIIKNIEEYNPIEHSYAFLIDKERYSIALPEQAYKDMFGRIRSANESRTNLSNITNEFGPVINKMKSGLSGFQNMSLDNKELYVAYAPLKSTGFSLGIVVEKEVVLKAVSDMQKKVEESEQRMIYLYILPTGLAIIMVAWLLGVLYTNRMVKPIQKLTENIKEISRGNFDIKPDIKSSNEIGQLASSFSEMTTDLKESRKKLEEYSKTLEKQVAERTAELESKVKELNDIQTAILNMMEDSDEANKELIKTHGELKINLEKLKEMDKKKDEFISVAAHELKTPLTSIHGFSQLLQDKDIIKNDEKRGKYLKIVDKETNRLAKLVTDILDLSRIDLGTFKLNEEETDLNMLMEDVMKEAAMLAKEKNMELEQDIEKDLPKIFTDKDRLIEVLLNLINNAVKYTPKGTITMKVHVENGFVIFSVKDTGIGIAEKDQKRLFERFFQVDSSYTRKAGGTGLGLALSKEYVKAMSGEIWFKSELGKGSEFSFRIPIKNPRKND